MTYLAEGKEYEDGILNAILSFPEDHPKIFNRLNKHHFSSNINCKAYGVLQALYQQNKPNTISNTAIVAELCTLLKREKIDWRWWARHLTQEAPLATDIEFYMSRIIRNYNKRRITEVTNAVEKKIEGGETPESVTAYTKSEFDKLERENVCGGPVNFLDVATECISTLETNGNTLPGIQTGLVEFDTRILGMRPGDLIIIAGRPGMGKTTLATNISIHAAKQGYTGLIFSLEMSQYRLGLRIIASETGCNLYELSRGQVSDWHAVCDIGNSLQNLYIDFSTGLSCQDVIGRINEFKDTSQLDFIMLDYLQKMNFPGNERHDIKIGKATGEFKNIAKELDIPFILLSQLSRASEKDGRKVRTPRMSDLKDSGSIEQDADVIALIHRKEAYEPNNEEHHNVADIALAKNRDGETGLFKLTFRKEINKFVNYTDDEYA